MVAYYYVQCQTFVKRVSAEVLVKVPGVQRVSPEEDSGTVEKCIPPNLQRQFQQ